jgi:ABC-type Zn uptake system ZnuABC Zn-binding protein ZnuA
MKRTIFLYTTYLFILFFTLGCGEKDTVNKRAQFVTTNQPVTMIMREILGSDEDVYCIVKPGTSEHTYTPKPADISRLENALAVFYISDKMDGWTVNFDNVDKIQLIDEIPDSLLLYFPGTEKTKNNIDPHFWTDPVVVKHLVPELVRLMSRYMPEKKSVFEANGKKLIERLDSLDREIRDALAKYKNRSVLLFHPSFLYFLKRYGLRYAGAIETSPGKHPTFEDLTILKEKIKALNIKAIFVEPQLPKTSVYALTDNTNLKILELDPIGGTKGKNNYFELMRFNLKNIIEGLKNN